VQLIYPNRPLVWHPFIHRLQAALTNESDVYLVGGTVRDAYRDYPLKDIDICSRDSGIRLGRLIADAFNGDFYPLDQERGFGRSLVEAEGQTWQIDIAQWVGDSLEADLYNRDFTVNAMAVDINRDLQGIYDPTGGLTDWQHNVLRRCTESSLTNDPVRIVRAVRQSIQLDLKIEPHTLKDIRHTTPLLMQQTSAERLRDELFKLLDGKKPHAALNVLQMLGVMNEILPATQTLDREQWRTTLLEIEKLDTLLMVISPRRDDNVAANIAFGTFVYLLDQQRAMLQELTAKQYANEHTLRMLLTLAILLRNTLQDTTSIGEWLRDLNLSRQEIQTIQGALAHIQLPWTLFETNPTPSPEQIYDYWAISQTHGVNAIWLQLSLYLAKPAASGYTINTDEWSALLGMCRDLFAAYQDVLAAQPPINGQVLQDELGLEPSPLLGELLAALRKAAYLGVVTNKDEALAFVKQRLTP